LVLAKDQMWVATANVARMTPKGLFLLADAALRTVIDTITPAQLALPAPATWTRVANPTVRDLVAAHAKDEAWVPDVLAGRTMDEVGTSWDGDLLGADPIAAYDRLNDLATAAVTASNDPDAIAHLSYGDFPVSVFFEHTTYYRAFQAWSIAKLTGLDYSLPGELVDGLWELVMPQLDDLRAIHVFGPEVQVPEGADKQTRLLGKSGFWTD
jgi:uncharacterized protein (TIGR03086 family)